MSIASDMKSRALAEFDRLVAEKEREIRFRMAAAGASPFEINAYIESCHSGLAEQRAGIGRLVSVELMKAGVFEEGMGNDVPA